MKAQETVFSRVIINPNLLYEFIKNYNVQDK